MRKTNQPVLLNGRSVGLRPLLILILLLLRVTIFLNALFMFVKLVSCRIEFQHAAHTPHPLAHSHEEEESVGRAVVTPQRRRRHAMLWHGMAAGGAAAGT